MGESYRFPLPIVDGLRLDKSLRDALLPDRQVHDDRGAMRRLPRFFYEIASWETAMSVQVSPNFGLWEFIQTDVREAAALRGFPRYVPCAITMLARVFTGSPSRRRQLRHARIDHVVVLGANSRRAASESPISRSSTP